MVKQRQNKIKQTAKDRQQVLKINRMTKSKAQDEAAGLHQRIRRRSNYAAYKELSIQAKINKYLVTSNPGICHALKPKLNTK